MALIVSEFELSVREVADRLSRGDLVGLATDSTYAIVAAVSSRAGVQALRDQRAVPPSKHLSLLLKDLSHISEYAFLDRTAYRLVKKLTPGHYTFIFRATKQVPRMMLTKQRTVGVRICGVPIVDALCAALDQPLVSASATLSPQKYAASAQELADAFSGIALVLDGGVRTPELSTVVDLTGAAPRILREGAGPIDLLEAR